MGSQRGAAVRVAGCLVPVFLACMSMTFGGLANAQKVTTANGWVRKEDQDPITDEKSFWILKKVASGFSGHLALICDGVGADIYGGILFSPMELSGRIGNSRDVTTFRFDKGDPISIDGVYVSDDVSKFSFENRSEILQKMRTSGTLALRVTSSGLLGTDVPKTGTINLAGSTSAIDWLEKKCGVVEKREAQKAAIAPVIAAAIAAAEADMIRVPGGTFLMGSPTIEDGRSDDEGPQHPVTVQPFEVSQYEVTWALWDACVADGGCSVLLDDGFGKDDRPVTNVSWNEAVAYTKWLSNKTRKPYRLLSEAQWEYAARAGTTTPFSFGSTISTSQANYNGNYTYGNGSKSEYRRKTTAVGTFSANALGLYDMHGNVYEWVEDCYENSYSADQPSDGGAYTSGSCSGRVYRGGSWNDDPQNLRSAIRNWDLPTDRSGSIGFRVARTLSTP